MKFDNIFNNSDFELIEKDTDSLWGKQLEPFSTLTGKFKNPVDIREELIHNWGITCPHCKSTQLKVHERTKRLRFKCLGCNKTFTSTHGTAVHGIHSIEKWRRFIPLLLQSRSIRFIAKELQISTRTSFDWRHKALSALSARQTSITTTGVMEIKEIHFDYCEKGIKCRVKNQKKNKIKSKKSAKVAVLAVHRRASNQTELRVVQWRKIQKTAITNHLEPCAAKIVCDIQNKSIHNWAKASKIKCQTVPTMKNQVMQNIDPLLNLKINLNLFERWFARFYGVASKYLNNYLAWHNLLIELKKIKNVAEQTFFELLHGQNTTNKFKRISEDFNKIKPSHIFAT